MTDLEAIAAKYDENGDNVLDANDSAYGKFGVWIDSDLDGNSDEGEFVTLSDAGITSIELVSDGIQEVAADGDVVVFGTASFTWADGSTGEVSDAGFYTGSDTDATMMEALLAVTTQEGDNEQVELASLDGAQEEAEVAAILEDVMSDGVVDAMIDQFAGDHGVTNVEASYLGDGALAYKIDGGAFVFDGNAVADIQDDAAAMAAVNA